MNSDKFLKQKKGHTAIYFSVFKGYYKQATTYPFYPLSNSSHSQINTLN